MPASAPTSGRLCSQRGCHVPVGEAPPACPARRKRPGGGRGLTAGRQTGTARWSDVLRAAVRPRVGLRHPPPSFSFLLGEPYRIGGGRQAVPFCWPPRLAAIGKQGGRCDLFKPAAKAIWLARGTIGYRGSISRRGSASARDGNELTGRTDFGSRLGPEWCGRLAELRARKTVGISNNACELLRRRTPLGGI